VCLQDTGRDQKREPVSLEALPSFLNDQLARLMEDLHLLWHSTVGVEGLLGIEDLLQALHAMKLRLAPWEVWALRDRALDAHGRWITLQAAQFAYGWHVRLRVRQLGLLFRREGPCKDPLALLYASGFELFYTASSIESLNGSAAGVHPVAARRRELQKSSVVQAAIVGVWNKLRGLTDTDDCMKDGVHATAVVHMARRLGHPGLREMTDCKAFAKKLWTQACLLSRITDWSQKERGDEHRTRLDGFFGSCMAVLDEALLREEEDARRGKAEEGRSSGGGGAASAGGAAGRVAGNPAGKTRWEGAGDDERPPLSKIDPLEYEYRVVSSLQVLLTPTPTAL